MTPAVTKVLSLFLAIVAVNGQAAQPHRSCSFLEDSIFGQHVTCGTLSVWKHTIVFPLSFKVGNLSPQIHSLEVTSQDHGVVWEDYEPLPARRRLINVMFTNFNLHPVMPRFPLAGLLVNNKHHIQQIHLTQVKLLTLSAEDFLGFNDLAIIKFDRVQLNSVGISVFAELGVLASSGEVIKRFQPLLEEIQIIGDKSLRELDWSYLRPVSTSIQRIDLSDNGLESAALTSSTPFVFQNPVSVKLDGNKLNKMSSAIYEIFNSNRDHEISLAVQDPLFCCTCCDSRPFFDFLRRRPNVAGHVNCDFNVTHESLTFKKLLPLLVPDNLLQHCKAVDASVQAPGLKSVLGAAAVEVPVQGGVVEEVVVEELPELDVPTAGPISRANALFAEFKMTPLIFLLSCNCFLLTFGEKM